jgi:salicylate hydroxylase
MRIVIVGAGIGGLALALSLRRVGIDYVVLERARALEFVGAGIQLSPNATRILQRLGVLAELEPMIVRPGHHRFIDWQTADELLVTPLGDLVRDTFGSIYAHAHRAHLLDALATAIGDDERIRLGTEVARVTSEASGASAVLESGEVVSGDIVVAADGVRSQIRETMFHPQPPRFSGCMAWRGLTPAEHVRELGLKHDSYVFMGPARSMVVYYVASGALVNWIGIGPSDGDTPESWTTQGSVADALREYEDWHPTVRQIIEASAAPFKWALYDREPLEQWVNQRIVLLGDAAHAMLPYHAQGAAQSIEDAWVLARSLEIHADTVDQALAHYEALRKPRATQVQDASRAAMHLFQMSLPEDIAKRNARFAKTQETIGEGFPPGQEWLFAYDAEQAVTGTDRQWQTKTWRQ